MELPKKCLPNKIIIYINFSQLNIMAFFSFAFFINSHLIIKLFFILRSVT